MDFKYEISASPFNQIIDKTKGRPRRRELFRMTGAHVARATKSNARSVIGGNFGKKIANSVSKDFDASGVTVGAAHFAARHKHFGGKISAPGKGEGATGAKMLSIPINKKAKGKSPRDFNDLFCQRSRKGNLILFQKGEKKPLPLFVLKKSVTHKAYPWFPEGEKLNKPIEAGIKQWLATYNKGK